MTYPNLPYMVETKSLCPDADHTPAIKQYYANSNCIEHDLSVQLIPTLDPPKRVNASCLRRNPNNEQIGKFECIILNDSVL